MIRFFLFFILTIATLQAIPIWYANHTVKSNSNIYYGYGQGLTKKEAYQNAASEISNQLKVEISSIFKIEDRVRNDNVTNFVSKHITSNSHSILKNIKIIESTKDNNIFYILLEYNYTTPRWYESRTVEAPLFSKLGYGQAYRQSKAINMAKEDLKSQGIDILKEVKPRKSEIINDTYFVAVSYRRVPKLECHPSQNEFLSKTSLVQEANKLTNCQHDYQLRYFNNAWHLSYKKISEKLTPRELSSLLINVDSKEVSIETHKYDFHEGEGFYLNITSKKSGYVSVLNVYRDGRVGVVLKNKIVNDNANFSFPSKESGQEFVASLITPSVATKDMYVVLYSKTKLKLSKFEKQNSKKVTDKEYRFNEVLKLLKTYDYATLVLRTRPN